MNKIKHTNEEDPHMTEKEARVHAWTVGIFKKFWYWIQPYFALFIVVILGCLAAFSIIYFIPDDSSSSSDSSSYSSASSDGNDSSKDCNVLGLNLHGMLLTYLPPGNDDDPLSDKDVTGSEEIVMAIQRAQDDDNIKAILLEIDSGGGMPVAGEEIAEALKESSKPSVAVIRQTGASAAYWAATGADKIFASKNSDVGSIGVTMSYLEDIDKNKKWVSLSTGEYKDAGNPDKPLTEPERKLLLRDLNLVYQNFIQAVSDNRKIPVDDVKAIADGSTVLGDKAKSLNLIDEIGSWSQAEQYLQEEIGAKPDICWY